MALGTRKNTETVMRMFRLVPSFRRRIMQMSVMSLAFACLGFFAGCGGGGSSGAAAGGQTISALSIPSRIELTKVSDADLNAAGSRAMAPLSRTAADAGIYNGQGTDYANLEKRAWVEDIAQALQMVNEILEVVKDTGYTTMVNKGAYVALVKSPGDQNVSQGGGAATSTVTEQLSEMTVDVVRQSNSEPMYVYFWMKEEMGPGSDAAMIKGRFEVTQAVSDAYPMGEMTAYIIGRLLDDQGLETGEPIMKIGLTIRSENDRAVVEFAQREQMEDQGYLVNMESEMRVEAANDFQSGKAYVHEYGPDWGDFQNWGDTPTYATSIMQVAYDPDHLKIDNDGAISIYDKTDLNHRVNRYKLFDSDGNAVKINSGFPVKFKDSNAYGYVGYYGLWAPDNVTIDDSTTVIKEDTGQEYQLIQVGGKLIKHTQKTVTLAKLADTEMFHWNQQADAEDIIVWNSDNEKFMKIGERANGDSQYWQAAEPAAFEEWERAWCDALQADIPVGQLYTSGNATNDSMLTYHAQKTMIPGVDTFPGDLYMIGPGIDEDPYTYNWTSPGPQHHYIYDAASMVLTENGQPVIYQGDDWGRELSPLSTVPDSTGWEDDVYYSWVSGRDQWCKLTILKDGQGAPVSFEAPLLLTYEHRTGYDYNYDQADPNDGRLFNIEYDGYELRVPWVYDEISGEYVPQLNLRDSHVSGLELTGDDGHTYVLKGWEEELMMAALQAGDPAYDEVAAALDTAAAIDEPTIDDNLDTAIANLFDNPDAWAKPTDVQVKIIKGELVDAR